MDLVWFLLAIATGGTALLWGSGQLIDGASAMARQLKVSPLTIGMTVVAFGTSLPELATSIRAALAGSSNIAVGNALGSNIANIGLVVGTVALLGGIRFQTSLLKKEFPLMLGISLIAGLMLSNGQLSRREGLLLSLLLLPVLLLMIRPRDQAVHPGTKEEMTGSFGRTLLVVMAGLGILLLGVESLLWGAQGVAKAFGISDLVIGLSVVAVGTSLPELAASIAGIARDQHDISLGNILGSNLFNLLLVLGTPIMIHPATPGPEAFQRDYAVMMAFSLALALFMMIKGRNRPEGRMGRGIGGLLLVCYASYCLLILHGDGQRS